MDKGKRTKQAKTKKRTQPDVAKQPTSRGKKASTGRAKAGLVNTNQVYMVSGLVTYADATPAAGQIVSAYDQDMSGITLLGQATTDSKGAYEIRYTEAQFRLTASERGNADVFVRVHNARQEQLFQSTTVRSAPALLQLNLQLPVGQFVVRGTVRNELGELLNGVTVQAFDRDLRSEQLLGSTQTTAGRYEINYQRAQFSKAEKDSADLVMKVFNTTGLELYKTPVQFNAPAELQLDINLQDVAYQGPSVWAKLTEMLTPLLEDVAPLDLREDERFQDISFLAGETGHSRLSLILCAPYLHIPY